MSKLIKDTLAELNAEISQLKEDNELIGTALQKMQMMAAMQQVIFSVVLYDIPSKHNPINYDGFKESILNKVISEEVKKTFLETESEANLQLYETVVSRVLDDIIESYNNYMTAENDAKDNQTN